VCSLFATRLVTHAHTCLTALFPGLPRWAGTRKVKPVRILLKQETVSGSVINWAICKSAPCFRQTTTPAHHHSVFTGQRPFVPPNQQRQITEGTSLIISVNKDYQMRRRWFRWCWRWRRLVRLATGRVDAIASTCLSQYSASSGSSCTSLSKL